MGHTQQVCVRIVLLPLNVWQQFFGRSAFLRQQETDLPPAELCLDPKTVLRMSFRGVPSRNLGEMDCGKDIIQSRRGKEWMEINPAETYGGHGICGHFKSEAESSSIILLHARLCGNSF
ncbi:hypothetical protein TNCV_1760571 [Trichonephila clavipes]|nr:hypothetical protein TNCV_1760571 [Trichonephila clavipes]